MRTIITIFSIFIILIGGSFTSYRYVETRTQTMGALLESVEDSIIAQKWEGAQADLNIAQQNWKADITWWSIILDHQEIDSININMKRLEKFIGIQDVSLSLSEVTTLELLFENIYETELLNIENIF